MAAAVIATALTRAVVGGGPIYGQRSFVLQSPGDSRRLPLWACFAALAAFGFKSTLALLEHWLVRHPIPQPGRAALGGLLVGAIAVWVPDVAGNGYEPLNLILDQRLLLSVVVVLSIAKVLATSGSVASGVPGGIFTAVFLVGGVTGLCGHTCCHCSGYLRRRNAG